MKLSNAQVDAMTGQIVYLIQDGYDRHNKEVVEKTEKIYEAAANKVPDLKEYMNDISRNRTYNPHEGTFRAFLQKKFPEDFKDIPPTKNIGLARDAIRRDIVIVAPECKTTEEVLARVTTKYVV